MSKLSIDPNWTEIIVRSVDKGKLETRCFLSWLAKTVQATTYLELGVRRGFSMSTVASRAPEVNAYGFDLWVRDYGGSENPGTDFVRGELAKVGHCGDVVFVSGNSHKTVPAFFGDSRASWFQRRRLRALSEQHQRNLT